MTSQSDFGPTVPSRDERYHTTDDALGVWDLRLCGDVYRSLPIAGKSLLDVGCRDGWHSTLFESMGAEVTCLDRYDSPYRPKTLNYLQYDIFQFPAFRKWDIVFCGDVIQHVEGPLSLLRKLHTLAKEALYLATDVHPVLGRNAIVHVPSVPYLWGEEHITDLIRLAGFTDIERLAHWAIPANKPEYREEMPEGRSVMLFEAKV